MPLIFTDGPLRIPAQQRFRRNGGVMLDSSFWALIAISVLVASFSLFYPQMQDFVALNELYYNLDFESRITFDTLHNQQHQTSLLMNLTHFINQYNTTCFHTETYFYPTFVHRQNYNHYDIEEVYTTSFRPPPSAQPSLLYQKFINSSSSHLTLPATFNYTCIEPHFFPKQDLETIPPAFLSSQIINDLLIDISTSISILHESHVIPIYNSLRTQYQQMQSKQLSKISQSKLPQVNTANQNTPIAWKQHPIPTRYSHTTLGADIVCHHRLFCGFYNNLMSHFSVHLYIFIQYIADFAKQCDFFRQSTTIAPDFTIIESSFFQSNPIITIFQTAINFVKAIFIIILQAITNYSRFTEIYSTTSARYRLVPFIQALRSHPFITHAYRYDLTFNLLSTLHHMLLHQIPLK